MHTQTTGWFLWMEEGSIGAIPAFRAGVIVVTFLLAALAPLGVFVLLVGGHLLAGILSTVPEKGREAHRARLFRNLLSDASLLFLALSVGLFAEAVLTDVAGGFLSIAIVLGGVMYPKFQLLRRIVFSDDHRFDPAACKHMLTVSAVLLVVLPFFTSQDIGEILWIALRQLVESRF